MLEREATVFISAVMEYIAAEIVEVAQTDAQTGAKSPLFPFHSDADKIEGQTRKDEGQTITVADVVLRTSSDEEISDLLQDYKCQRKTKGRLLFTRCAASTRKEKLAMDTWRSRAEEMFQ
jgi:hypothetical protein